ncbi:MAG: response regulator [Phycisphaerae bacterium]|nr:response regulator [Phycisphaerae bacterium]NIX28914.1 response regulator [Phycisphaerae bacterium]
MTNILLVDDDKTSGNLIKLLLEMDGFNVTISPDLEQARQKTTKEITAFIIDCNLSRGDNGIELLREIREGKTAVPADTPVIMTSGDDRRSREAAASGATIFLLKPYPPSRLSDELKNLTGN